MSLVTHGYVVRAGDHLAGRHSKYRLKSVVARVDREHPETRISFLGNRSSWRLRSQPRLWRVYDNLPIDLHVIHVRRIRRLRLDHVLRSQERPGAPPWRQLSKIAAGRRRRYEWGECQVPGWSGAT